MKKEETIETENKPAQDFAAAASALTDDEIALAPKQESWGDAHKGKAFGFTKNILVNYLINATGSATLAYWFDRKWGDTKFKPWIKEKSEELSEKTGASSEATYWVANFFTRGQILLAGGHFLMPVIKWMNESRLSMEYWFSKKLDGLQQMVGLGNAKTKQNLESYDKVDALLEKGGQGETVELTPYMRSLLEQHSIGDDLKFEEEKESWGTMIKARLWSIASASVTNISLGLLSSRKIIKNWSYAESEERGGNWFHEKIMSKVPGFDHVVKDGGMWSRYVINDAILTAASAAAFHQTEKKAKAKKNAARTEQSDLPASDAPATSERTAPAHQPETEVKPSNHADRFAPAAAKHGERQTLRRETAEAVPQQI